MKQRIRATLLAALAVSPHCLAADSEPQGLFYLKLPFGAGSAYERAPDLGVMVTGRTDGTFAGATSRMPLLHFSLSGDAGRSVRVFGLEAYRRKANGDASIAATPAGQMNWWVVGGVAAAFVLLAKDRKSSPQEDPRACIPAVPPPPGAAC